MGVLGLWEILQSVGHPVKIEGLEGKVLGVDANIWLYKFIRGFRDKDNVTSIESHKLGLFNRLCKLLFYRIKPVFVFDGPAPVLKRRTLERRQNIRSKHLMQYQSKAASLLAKQLKSQFPDADIDHLQVVMPNLVSNNLVAAEKLTDDDRDLFYLPDTGKLKADDDESDASDSQDLFDDHRYMTTEVDINSKDFEHLPAETRYEILHDIKQERKRIRNASNLPEDANSFSNYQLQRLKARRIVQEKIEECEKEICSNYTGELADGSSIQAFRVQSDSRATILYRNNTYDPKALERVKQEECKFEDVDKPRVIENVEEKDRATSSLAATREAKSKTNVSSQRLIRTKEISIKRLANRLKSYKKGDKSETAASPDLSSPDLLLSPSGSESPDLDATNLGSPKANSRAPKASSPAPRANSPAPEANSPARSTQTELYDSDSPPPSTSQNPTKDVSRDSDVLILHENKNQTILIDSDNEDNLTNRTEYISDSPESGDELHAEPANQSNVQSGMSPKPHGSAEFNHGDINFNDDSLFSEEEAMLDETKPSETNPTEIKTGDTKSAESKPVESAEPKPVESYPANNEKPSKPISSQTMQEVRQDETSNQSHLPSSQPRATNRVTNKIVEDAKELLRLFGIPYIDAAGEAEAQCAKLEELKLTEGTITDDSDIWLFGSQNVYRYFFSDDKYVMQYKMNDIEFYIRMTRENLVCFAMLVGSDYTDGIMNVGPVAALEVLSEFPGEGMEPLVQFRDWHKESKKDLKAAKKVVKRRKLLKYIIPDEFPSRAVYDGYMRPGTDTSTEKFTWGTPELDELREYARRNFGWDPKKVDDKLVPVMKRLNEKKIQKTIDTFFFKTQANKNPEMFRSKRVNQALNKIAKRAAREGKAPMVPDEVNLSEEDDM